MRVKNENCEFLQNLCTLEIFLQLCQLKLLGCSPCFPLRQRKFTVQKPRNTIQKSGRFKKQAKHLYQQLPQQRYLCSERVFDMQSNALGFHYSPSTECYVINIFQRKNYLWTHLNLTGHSTLHLLVLVTLVLFLFLFLFCFCCCVFISLYLIVLCCLRLVV